MDLILTEEEHQALPANRQNGDKQEDGTYRIALESDPWVQIDAATSERDAMKSERDKFRNERDEARKQRKDQVGENTLLKRSLKEFTIHGSPEDFASARRRISDMPTPEDPKMVEMQTQLDTMKKERDEEVKAREAAEAGRLADTRRSLLRSFATKAGIKPEFASMYVGDLERRGLSEDAGRLYVGPTGNMRSAEDLINEELGGVYKMLSRNAVPSPGGRDDSQPVPDLDPNAVTLSGDPRERQRALNKLSDELYPNMVSRVAGPAVSRT